MKAFQYQRTTTPAEALHAGTIRGAKFLAGGTNLVDLMKYGVESPTTLVDINRLDLAQVSA
jgi:xanthine dehydrogenase YagS FAD-binding subunit